MVDWSNKPQPFIDIFNVILKHHDDVLRHTMSEYGYHANLADYLYRTQVFVYKDHDTLTRMRLIIYADSTHPKRVLEKWMRHVEYDTRIQVFNEMCGEQGGEPSPIPCSWYNAYCEEGEECVYAEEPLFMDEELGMYCCRPVRQG